MGVEIQTITDGVQPGGAATFVFDNPVQAYALGIAAFNLFYEGDDGHHVQTLRLAVDGELTMVDEVANTSNTVTVHVSAELSDASGNQISSSSRVYPCCVAVTGSPDTGNTTLGTYTPVSSNQSDPVQLPTDSGFNFVTSFLDGFELSYGNDVDHQVLTAGVSCNLTYTGSQGTLKGTATMTNGSAVATTAEVTPSAFATLNSDAVIAVHPIHAQTHSAQDVTFDGMTTISDAIVLIHAWHVEFEDQHDVFAIGAGSFDTSESTFQPPTLDGGNKVTLPSLFAYVHNVSGDHQDDTRSYAEALLVAVA